MECKHHRNMTEEQFDNETCKFKNRFDLYYFLLNTLSFITYNGYYYCFCGEKKFKKKKKKIKNDVQFAKYQSFSPILKLICQATCLMRIF